MKKRTIFFGGAALVGAAAIVISTRAGLWQGGAGAQAPRVNAPPAIAVEVTTAEKKMVPVRIDALGSVTPIASVAVKPRVDSEIVGVHFRDGATVKTGDLLFTLDSRAIEDAGSVPEDRAGHRSHTFSPRPANRTARLRGKTR